MKLKNIPMVLAALAFTFACTKTELAEGFVPEEEVEIADSEEDCYQLGVANVYLSEELADAVEAELASAGVVTRASSEGLSELYASLGIVSMTRLFPDAGEYEPRTRKEGLHRWYKVTYDPSVTVTRASAGLREVEGVEIVEPVNKIKLTSFNDPYFYYQWHYYNDGGTRLGSGFKAGCDINVQPVWDNFTTGSRNVIVAVVDGGIAYTHEDLADNYVGGYNFVYNNSTVTAHEHGTHVAGTIGAVNNNGKGLCGIAGGDYANGVQGCGLLSCQIFTDDYSGDTASAIKYGADNGAVVCQNSWGYSYSTESAARNGSISSSDKSAIDYFVKYAGCDNDGNQLADSPMKGGVVVFAAGNDAWAYGWPAQYEAVIAVAATGPDFTPAYYTTYGDWVDICAPGGTDVVAYPYAMVCSTYPSNQYGWNEGTSMACPHVSGVCALLASYFGGPGFTADDLTEKLLNGANYDDMITSIPVGPLLDAYGAFCYANGSEPDKVSTYSATANSNNITFTWDVVGNDENVKANGFLLLASTDQSALSSADPANLPSSVYSEKVATGDYGIGDEMSGVLTVPEFNTRYYVAIYAYDYALRYSEISDIKNVTTGANNPPDISTTYSGDYALGPIEVLEVPFSIVDPDGHAVTVSLASGSAADSIEQTGDSVWTLTINSILVDEGSYTCTITATDAYGLSSTKSVTYTVAENLAPEVVKELDGVIFTAIGAEKSYTLSDYMTDPEGFDLTWEIVNSDASVISAEFDRFDSNVLTLAAMGTGEAEITIIGTDPKGKYNSTSFGVLISRGQPEPTAYPNPMTDVLYIKTGELMSTEITIYSSTGSKVYETTERVSAFSPAVIDVSGFAPGTYTVKVAYGNKEYTMKVSKV